MDPLCWVECNFQFGAKKVSEETTSLNLNMKYINQDKSKKLLVKKHWEKLWKILIPLDGFP